MYIKQNDKEAFIFENALDKACEKDLQGNKPQDELDTLIKKQGDKYYICKPLSVKYENINTNTESKKSQSNTKSNLESNKTNADKSSECDTESKRKNFYIKDEISFENCVFCGEIKFEYISFCELDFCLCDKSEGELKDSNQTSHIPQSLRIDFQHSEFSGNVFFNHAVFHKYADCHENPNGFLFNDDLLGFTYPLAT